MAIVYNGKGTATDVASTGPTTISPPAHSVGDFLLLCIMSDHTTDPATPTGWTSAGVGKDDGVTAASGVQINFFYRIATGTTTGQDQAAITGPSGTGFTGGVILSFSGVNPVSPIDTIGTNWSDVTSTNTHTFPNVTTVNNASMVLWFLSSANNGTCTIANTSAGSITNFVSVGSLWLSIASTGGLGFSHGDAATAGAQSGTRTGNWVTANAVGVAFALRIAPVTHTIAAITGTVSADAASINVKNKIGAAITGTIRNMSVATTAGQIAVKNKNRVTVTTALLGSVTGAAAIQNKDGIAVTGTLGAMTGTIAVANKVGVAVTGTLGAMTGAISIDISQTILTAVAGVLGGVTANIVVANKIGLDIAGTMAAITGAIVATETNVGTVAATLAPIVGTVEIAFRYNLNIAGVLGGLRGRVFAQIGPTFFPTDPDFIMAIPALERVLDVPGLNRTVAVPGLDRILKVG